MIVISISSRNNRTNCLEGHRKDHHTNEKRPYQMTFGELENYLVTKAISEAGAKMGKPPYGFIRQYLGGNTRLNVYKSYLQKRL